MNIIVHQTSPVVVSIPPADSFRLSFIVGQRGPQGEQGIQGIQGIQGETGATGQGLVTGGSTFQILRKKTATNFDTEWATNQTDFLSSMQALGSDIKAQTTGLNISMLNTAGALGNRQARMCPIWIPTDMTVTGISFLIGTQGNFTDNPSGVNTVALYRFDGTNAVKVGESANDLTMYTQAAGSFVKRNLTAPYVATPGLYWAAALWNNLTVVTAPTLAAHTSVSTALWYANSVTHTLKLTGALTNRFTFPASVTAWDVNSNINIWMGIY